MPDDPSQPSHSASSATPGASPKTTAPNQPTPTPPQKPARTLQLALKRLSISLLRTTVRSLETLATKLEAAPVETNGELWRRVRTVLGSIWTGWRGALRQIRPRLPQTVNQRLSDDRALTGVIASLLVLIVWFTSALLPSQPRTTDIARVPISQRQPPADLTAPPELVAPDEAQPIAVSPPIPRASGQPEPTVPDSAAPELAPAIEIAPSPAPIELTPEQSLIAALQTEIAAVTRDYADGLIQSIQANFSGSQLTVNIASNWYALEPFQQDKLADSVLRRSQELDFNRLSIIDSQGVLVARSPVVGSNMVVLKRKDLLAETTS